MAKKYGILAYPAGHSLSPVMFSAAFKSMKIKAEYKAYEIEEVDLDDFIKTVKSDFAGLSVSLPYKEMVIKYLDEIDDHAQKIGAVNTIVNNNGSLVGYNTDFLGSNKAITGVMNGLGIKGMIAVIIGAGGAARAIAYGLLSLGVNVWIKNRTKSRADAIAIELAELFDAEIHSEELDNPRTGDILINATSFWIQNPDVDEENLPKFCDENFLKTFKVVMDISYNVHLRNFPDPLMTPLLIKAEELGLKTICGDKMLLYQAAEQFKLWTGKEAPVEVMKEAMGKAIGKRCFD